jgi:hypothetical protein
VFSRGRHLLSFTRNRLTGNSIRKFLCFGSWSQKDLVRDSDVIAGIEASMGARATRQKAKQKRKAEDQSDGAEQVKKARTD